jgi:hypothetical protein
LKWYGCQGKPGSNNQRPQRRSLAIAGATLAFVIFGSVRIFSVDMNCGNTVSIGRSRCESAGQSGGMLQPGAPTKLTRQMVNSTTKTLSKWSRERKTGGDDSVPEMVIGRLYRAFNVPCRKVCQESFDLCEGLFHEKTLLEMESLEPVKLIVTIRCRRRLWSPR